MKNNNLVVFVVVRPQMDYNDDNKKHSITYYLSWADASFDKGDMQIWIYSIKKMSLFWL